MHPSSPNGSAPAPVFRGVLGFALVLWIVSTLCYAGDLGRWADDYSMARVDPVTGELRLPATQLPERPFFMRPVYFFVAHNLITIFYGREQVVHILMALAHGAAALLLFRVLRRAGLGARGAGAGAMVFMVAPCCHQSVFWMAAMGNDASLIAFLALALFAMRAAHSPPRPWTLLAAAALAFNIPCWNEQAAAAMPALPLLCLAARGPQQRAGVTLRRALVITAACGVGAALYVLCMVATTPPGERGSAASIIPLHEALPRYFEIACEARSWMFGRRAADLLLGGLINARNAVEPFSLGVVGALLVAGSAALVRAWTRPSELEPMDARPATPRPLWLAAFGASVAALSLLPVAAIRAQHIESRLCTVPVAGLAIVLAGAVDAMLASACRRKSRLAPALVATPLALACALGAAAMAGMQMQYRQRDRTDSAMVNALVQCTPGLPGGTVLVPLVPAPWAAATGRHHFDTSLTGATAMPWAISSLVRQTFRRADLMATPFNPWAGLELRNISSDSFEVGCFMPDPTLARGADGRTTIPWARSAPFVLDENDEPVFVRRLWFEDVEGDDTLVARTGVPAGARALSSFVMARPGGPPALPLVGWRRDGWGLEYPIEPVETLSRLGISRPVMCLEAAPDPARLVVGMPASPTRSRIVFRVVPADMCAGAPGPTNVRVRCFWTSEPNSTLGEFASTLADLGGQGRWAPVAAELGELDAERPICLEVSADVPVRLIVTPGARVFRAGPPKESLAGG